MLNCLPTSLFSWNYTVTGSTVGPASLTFNRFTEQGAIDFAGVHYDIVKHGPLSGHWTLEQPGGVVAEAIKPSAFAREFNLSAGDGTQLTLKAISAFGRSYEILRGPSQIGTIRPKHLFTRKATIECMRSTNELIQLFAFWLAAITSAAGCEQ